MKEPSSALGPKTKVRTDTHLSTIVGFGITPDAAKRRRPNAIAEIVGLVAGAGGDLYWCKHGDRVKAKRSIGGVGCETFVTPARKSS